MRVWGTTDGQLASQRYDAATTLVTASEKIWIGQIEYLCREAGLFSLYIDEQLVATAHSTGAGAAEVTFSGLSVRFMPWEPRAVSIRRADGDAMIINYRSGGTIDLGEFSLAGWAEVGEEVAGNFVIPLKLSETVPVRGEFDLKWDQSGDRRYQWGVDRVAYYSLMNYPSAGEVWNGVVSVQEDSDGGEVSSMFYGGEKYGVYLAKEDFVATITGFYLPPSLEVAAGYRYLGPGFIATLQPKEPFDLTYRTFVGDDHFGPEAHYRIHIVYGCMIEPYSTTHKTSTTRPEPGTTSWRIQTHPPHDMYSPNATAHYIVDTRYADPEVVAEVEEILYGRPGVPARMPGTHEWPSIFGFGNQPM